MRGRLKWSVAALLPVALLTIMMTPGSTRAQDPPDERPNVLVIVTDDQRINTMVVMRRTRRLLDAGGIKFTNAYVTTPQCCPSRASIFSGRYAHNHGVQSNQQGSNLNEDETMQAYLKAAGYRTGLVGKYLNGVSLGHRPPHFDRFAVRSGLRFYGATWNLNGRIREKKSYDTHVIRRTAANYLRQFENNDDDPWFLYLAPIAPHLPATAEKKYATARVPRRPSTPAMHEDDISDKPIFIQQSTRQRGPQIRIAIRRQLRSLLSVDDMVHLLVRKLTELGEKGRTLIIFTSDNGYLWRDHGIGGKGLPYIPAVHVPFLLRWPGEVAAGTTDDRLVANVDIAPTVLDAADVEPDAEMDGRSVLDPSWTRDRLLLEHWGWDHPAWASLINHEFQYIEYDDVEAPGVPVREYYDLVADPWQLSNLFGDDDVTNDPDTTALSIQLERDRACVGTDEGGPPVPPTCP